MKRIYHNCEINNRVENFLMDVLLIKPFDGSFKCVFFFLSFSWTVFFCTSFCIETRPLKFNVAVCQHIYTLSPSVFREVEGSGKYWSSLYLKTWKTGNAACHNTLGKWQQQPILLVKIYITNIFVILV